VLGLDACQLLEALPAVSDCNLPAERFAAAIGLSESYIAPGQIQNSAIAIKLYTLDVVPIGGKAEVPALMIFVAIKIKVREPPAF
jgi:hypothetical protein